MTDETKKLFDAPWKLYEYRDDYDHWFQVLTNGGRLIASRIVNKEDYNRLARLPELYDALADAVRESCCDCIDQVYDNPGTYDPVEQGCLFKDKHCCEKCRSWIALLSEIREGR